MSDTDGEFIVFGSILDRGAVANDIDMIVPEFNGEEPYCADVSLKPYEELSRETGKPIDLFFTTQESGFNLTAFFDEKGWTFRMAFCGRDFFLGATMVTRRMIQEMLHEHGTETIMGLARDRD